MGFLVPFSWVPSRYSVQTTRTRYRPFNCAIFVVFSTDLLEFTAIWEIDILIEGSPEFQLVSAYFIEGGDPFLETIY